MLVLIDNYDSFTYNVAHVLAVGGAQVTVIRNDEAEVADVLALAPAGIVISPGPGAPDSAGISVELIHAAGDSRIPVLGICLGMQSIAVAFGGRTARLDRLVHGEASPVLHDGRGVFVDMEQGFEAGRYHSLVVEESSLPDVLEASAHTEDGVLMGVRHTSLPVEGVQFHPESILTPRGGALLGRFAQGDVAA